MYRPGVRHAGARLGFSVLLALGISAACGAQAPVDSALARYIGSIRAGYVLKARSPVAGLALIHQR